ncbi:DUF2087 domain-containing protein [Pseudodesulfovibrio sp. F-1]|uniref:DUF2087 domain-containing protein n=1 Tax=Pseudodesulfovibrio alkaliphilus TaxID=2661613 RepID=A0A7K1KKW2_9BACT|nr:DUF2087 domain-containing protein [Pseudodesulfovibrio alkaliphilus]MUM76726.1 DUF2087 domain-containing protein [Pseudodesulfovibrio alkaliphilus]
MPRTPMPMCVGDVSDFARTLRRQLKDLERIPGHVEMLNLLARAGGFRNIQHLRAQQTPREALALSPSSSQVDPVLIKRLLRLFDDRRRLVRWPRKFTQRKLCLWVVWSRVPSRVVMTEKEINALIEAAHLFGDHALLRRELVDHGLLARTPDGRRYSRREGALPTQAAALLDHLRQRDQLQAPRHRH